MASKWPLPLSPSFSPSPCWSLSLCRFFLSLSHFFLPVITLIHFLLLAWLLHSLWLKKAFIYPVPVGHTHRHTHTHSHINAGTGQLCPTRPQAQTSSVGTNHPDNISGFISFWLCSALLWGRQTQKRGLSGKSMNYASVRGDRSPLTLSG